MRIHRVGSKVYIARNGIAIAYFDFKRMKYVKAPTHLKDGFNIIFTYNESDNLTPDVRRISADGIVKIGIIPTETNKLYQERYIMAQEESDRLMQPLRDFNVPVGNKPSNIKIHKVE